MVGPRSSGCRACVKRRIRCDRTRPRCRNCEKANLTCPGFRLPVVFMPPTTVSGGVRGLFGTALIHESEQANLVDQRTILQPNVFTEDRQLFQRIQLASNMPGLCPSLRTSSPSAYSDDVFCIFFLDRYFNFGNWNDDLQNNKEWFWQASQAPSQHPVSNIAARALFTAFFANANNSPEIRRDAYKLHNSALTTMSTVLQAGELSFDVLAATALLGLYETCQYTAKMAWQKHIRGMITLFRLKGPDYFRKRPARSLLMLCRFSIISEAIISRQRCFLADKRWSNILASDDSVSSLTVALGDIVLHQSGIFEDVKALEREHTAEDGIQKSQALLERLLNHLDELRKWWFQWSSDENRLPERTTLATVADNNMHAPPPMPGESEPTILRFRSLEAASGWCRYHAHILLALSWISRFLTLRVSSSRDVQAKAQSSSSINTTTKGSLDKHLSQILRSRSRAHALAVCEALYNYALPQYRHIGAVYMGLPTRVAWQALPQDSAHSRWIEELTEFMAAKSGFEFPRHMLREVDVND